MSVHCPKQQQRCIEPVETTTGPPSVANRRKIYNGKIYNVMIDTAIIPTLTCLDKLGQSHRRVDYTEDNDDKHPFTNTLILCYFVVCCARFQPGRWHRSCDSTAIGRHADARPGVDCRYGGGATVALALFYLDQRCDCRSDGSTVVVTGR